MVCLLAAAASFAFDIRPLIFRSGSMNPGISTGALGLAREVPAATIVVGDVVSVPNARGVRITHRVRTVTVSGSVATLVLQGDANPVPDAEPYVVTRADRLFFHVDRVGYVVAWLGHRSVVFAGGVLVGVLAAYAFRPGAAPVEGRRARRGPPGAAVAAAVLVTVAGVLLAPHATGTMAAFTDAGSATSGTFASKYWRCDSAILADGPRIYYKLNETGLTSTTAADASGQGRAGDYQGLVTKGVASPCTRDGGTAVTFVANSYVSLSTALTVPTAVSLEARFKTTSSTTTGMIVGFGASATGASATTDRVIYMATGGRVVFGMNTAAKVTIASTALYNDNAWHHVLATAGTDGMRLYVDGVQVATTPSTFTTTYNGSFRVGYDSLTGWIPAASGGQLLGSIDEAAVYSSTLTATDAAEHYRAAT